MYMYIHIYVCIYMYMYIYVSAHAYRANNVSKEEYIFNEQKNTRKNRKFKL